MVHNLLETLRPTLDAQCEIIIVDDGLPEIKIDSSALPSEVKYLSNDKNMGYSCAVNRGILESHGEYITTINSDILLDKNWLIETRKSFDKNPELGMLGAKLIYPNYGRVMHAGIFFGRLFCFNGFRMSLPDDSLVNEVMEVQGICDALATMPKKAIIEVGKYDETYFTSVEDLEMCFRLNQIGLRNIYNPSVVGYHKTAASLDHRYKQVKEDEKRFFEKWDSFIKDDTPEIFEKSLKRKFKGKEDIPGEAYVINLNRKNTKETLNSFLRFSGIKPVAIYDYSNYLEKTPKYIQKTNIDLLEVLPFSHLNLRYPIVYIVDYYVSLEENTYWALNRRNPDDLIFDYAGPFEAR